MKGNKTKDIFEKVVKNLQTIVENGEYTKFLKFQNNFNNYSFNNLVLIFSQYPEASKVAGKSKWRKLNREIKKGAKKIWIIAPIPRKYTQVTKKINEDGEEIEEKKEIKYNWYRYVFVYDISQTEGEPISIPLQCQNLESNDKAFFYEKLKKYSQYPIHEEKIVNGAKGFYNPKTESITIKEDLSINDKVAVLLHELSHAMFDDFDYSKDRDLSEVFVESIAYIVANHFGLDTSLYSFNYIIKWAKGEPKKVIELGNKIQKCSNKLIKDIEEFEMQEQELQLAA